MPEKNKCFKGIGEAEQYLKGLKGLDLYNNVNADCDDNDLFCNNLGMKILNYICSGTNTKCT